MAHKLDANSTAGAIVDSHDTSKIRFPLTEISSNIGIETAGALAVVTSGDQIGGRYLESCAVAPLNDLENPIADGVRSYAQDAKTVTASWAKSEAMIKAA